MHRFFVEHPATETAVITGEDVRHICKVLRLSVGDPVTLCDGKGMDCAAVIREMNDGAVFCSCGAWVRASTEPEVKVALFQGLPKTGKMETIIQKCVELGVTAVVPTQMARCVVVPGAEYQKKLMRYRRVAEEAAKQSRRGCVPEVLPLCTTTDIDPTAYDAMFVAYEEEHNVSFKQALTGFSGRRVAFLVGPEGGIEPEERNVLVRKGAVCVSLGARILRTETAGMAMLAQLMYEVES